MEGSADVSNLTSCVQNVRQKRSSNQGYWSKDLEYLAPASAPLQAVEDEDFVRDSCPRSPLRSKHDDPLCAPPR